MTRNDLRLDMIDLLLCELRKGNVSAAAPLIELSHDLPTASADPEAEARKFLSVIVTHCELAASATDGGYRSAADLQIFSEGQASVIDELKARLAAGPVQA